MTLKQYLRYFDWIGFGLIVLLLSVGLLFVFSTTSKENILLSPFFKKQLFGAVSGIVIYFVFSFIDLQTICRWSFFGYFFVLGLLVYTIFVGFIGMGAKRWISLYFIKFQPSEMVKFALPMAFAYYFIEQKKQSFRPLSFSKFLFPLGMLGITFILK